MFQAFFFEGAGVAVVSPFKIHGAADVFLFLCISIFHCCLVDGLLLDTAALQWAFVFPVSLAVASVLLNSLIGAMDGFLVLRVHDGLDVLGATVGNFYCIPVKDFVERVAFREMLVYKPEK